MVVPDAIQYVLVLYQPALPKQAVAGAAVGTRLAGPVGNFPNIVEDVACFCI